MRSYEVKLYFKGSEVFYIDAPDEEEAIDLAHEELANMHEFDNLEVIDSESCEDDDPEGEW
jgi:hypothetical protein